MAIEYKPWSFDYFWNKAVVYAARAHKQDREGEEFPFWSLLTLELIGRAALAHTHPALLADSKSDDNVMTAFGFRKDKEPRSIAANLVFQRCSVIVEAFSDTDVKRCIGLMEFRNREVHTGEPVFAGWSTSEWLSDYYRILKILVTHVGKTLEDLLLRKEDIAHAEELIIAAEAKNITEVTQRVNNAKTCFDALSDDEHEQRRAESARHKFVKPNGRIVSCPVCSSDAGLFGNLLRRTEDHLDEGELVSELTLQPSAFICTACGLKLGSLADLFAASKNNNAFASMISPFTLTERTSIEEYFEEYFETDRSDYLESNYPSNR